MSNPRASSSDAEPENPGSAEESTKAKVPGSLVELCATLPPPADPTKRQDLEDRLREECRELAARRNEANRFQTEVMSFHLGRWGIILLLAYMVLFGGTTTYTLMKIWPADSIPAPGGLSAAPGTPTTPGPLPPDSTQPATCAPMAACADTVVAFRVAGWFSGITFDFRPPHAGRRLLLIALLAGGLGAFLSSILSLATYIGERELTRSWAIWYLARPPAGMVLALLVYFLLRGGLLTPAASVSVVSPYGVAAFSGLIGMFVRQAMDKLRDIAETMFASSVKRSESVHGASPPSPGPAGAGTASAPPKPPATPGQVPAVPAAPQAVAAPHIQDPGA